MLTLYASIQRRKAGRVKDEELRKLQLLLPIQAPCPPMRPRNIQDFTVDSDCLGSAGTMLADYDIIPKIA
ncbi:hypothetical protein DPMN_024517 [Dreissena polymorpha]|uniref:Uncharacterized protein n=1 Tax=Dreissena polymorpha TaxID=45954 RepID=A0A9D4RCR9_DREPO|nr:hypothetical protein DPMN_024517 [Dreissena polymorpha]